jgi:hypothetical protein
MSEGTLMGRISCIFPGRKKGKIREKSEQTCLRRSFDE